MAEAAAAAAAPAAPAGGGGGGVVLPQSVLASSVGARILVVMKSNKEVEGTLVGLDEFVNLVLEDVVE